MDDENYARSDDVSGFVEMYRCSVAVENADFKRVTIKLEVRIELSCLYVSPFASKWKTSCT